MDEEYENYAAPATGAADQMSDSRVLRQALETLPEGQKQAITLLKLEQLSLKEASGVSGMSVVSLKVATHRAMKNLRKFFGNSQS